MEEALHDVPLYREFAGSVAISRSATIQSMVPLHVQLANSTLRGVIRRLHFPLEIMLVCVRWYAAYPLSLRNLEEMMAERGVLVDHATVHRWSRKMLPVLAKVFRRP
ncbi:hypothetical protein SRS16P2_00139 (plasmid) [Variovorax sp. SRS16]|nr:hypothetical protein SRS16P2_00139 [Variovorax sp. SRS16]